MSTESQPLQPSSEILPVGTHIEGHVIEQWLAAVPDGHVYRVTQSDTGSSALLHEYLPATWGRRIVDKVSARPGRGHEFRGGLHRFLQRAHQLAEIPHPGLPSLLRVWTSHGTAYCLMPDVRGRLLLDVVNSQGGSLPPSQVLPWVSACCEIAQWLHAQGKIHAAWDPSAVWVLEDGRLLLPAPDAGGGALPASPWVALEQTVLAPSGCEPGPWTDVFGIAALAGFLLTGKGPRGAPGGLRAAAAAGAITLTTNAGTRAIPPHGQAPGPSSAPPEALPAALMTAIRVSLRPNPRERPQDIGQFRGLAGLAQLTAQLGSPSAAPVEASLSALSAPPAGLSVPAASAAARPEPSGSEALLAAPDTRAFAITQPPLDTLPMELLAVVPTPLPQQLQTDPQPQPQPQPLLQPAGRSEAAAQRRASDSSRRKRAAPERTSDAKEAAVLPSNTAKTANPVGLNTSVQVPSVLTAALPAVVSQAVALEASESDPAPPLAMDLPLATRPEALFGHRELTPLTEGHALPASPASPPTWARRAKPQNGFHKELALTVMGVLAFATVWLLVAPADPAESQARKSSSGTLAQQQADLERELRLSPPAAGPAGPAGPSAKVEGPSLPVGPPLRPPARSAGPEAAAVAAAGLVAAAPVVAKAASAAPAQREATPPKAGAASARLSACTQALLEESLGAVPTRSGSDCR